MQGYKRAETVENVATLTACMGVRSGRYNMTELYSYATLVRRTG